MDLEALLNKAEVLTEALAISLIDVVHIKHERMIAVAATAPVEAAGEQTQSRAA